MPTLAKRGRRDSLRGSRVQHEEPRRYVDVQCDALDTRELDQTLDPPHLMLPEPRSLLQLIAHANLAQDDPIRSRRGDRERPPAGLAPKRRRHDDRPKGEVGINRSVLSIECHTTSEPADLRRSATCAKTAPGSAPTARCRSSRVSA